MLASNRWRCWTPQGVRLRVKIQNQLQAIALANGLRRGSSLWTQAGQHAIASLPLSPHAAYRRNELQAMYVKFETEIEKLNQRVEQQARERVGARLLVTEWQRGTFGVFGNECAVASKVIRRDH